MVLKIINQEVQGKKSIMSMLNAILMLLVIWNDVSTDEELNEEKIMISILNAYEYK